MQLDDFQYALPEHLIASRPLPERSASRLLHLQRESGALAHRQFSEIGALLQAGDLLVMNNTRVIPARLFGRKDSGGRVEIMLERMLDEQHARVQIRASKSPRPGTQIVLDSGHCLQVLGRHNEFFDLAAPDSVDLAALFREHGRLPLPHYMHREAEAADLERYQTVYASREGAVAAPTAGLHFTSELLDDLARAGIAQVQLTLHVGAGTFQPVRTADVTSHRMHEEFIEVPQSVVEAVASTRARGGKVIAVGTTVVRALESAARDGELKACRGDTDIFIYPGFAFQVIDGLITNFHLPGSTLLMLVSALAGRDHILSAYQQAVAHEYRFFSYGDAMFIDPRSFAA